jgi:hypothetical protein
MSAATSTTRTINDYLGAKGLDNEPVRDESGAVLQQPTWQPVDSEEFGNLVVERFRSFRTALETNGLFETWRRNYRQFFNGPAAPSSKDTGWGWADSFQILGDNGEILSVRLSEPRTLITRMANLACSKPVALRAVAKSATPEALEAAQIADSVIKGDFDPTEGGQLIRECVEMALAVTCAFMDAEWDQLAGEAYVPTDDGGMYYSGKPKLTVRMPDEVAFDLTKRTWNDVFDCIILQRANRYMLASQFPDFSDEILAQPSLSDSEFKSFRYDDEKTDDIVLLRYVHKAGNKSFLPEGRLGLVLENGTVIKDGSNPYALVDPTRLGLFPITAGSSLGSIYGYATMNDLSPLSQWLNLMATMVATLIAGYGAPNLTGPIMEAVQVNQMIGGGRYFGTPGGDKGKVEQLNLLDHNALNALLETMKFVIDMGEKHSGMSGLVREPGDGDSGKKVVAMQSMAVQFMSALQQSVIAVNKSLGNYLIRLRQKFSTSEEVAELAAGVGTSQQVLSYKASDKFPMVAHVEAEAVDPLSQTFEGRELRAKDLMQMGAFNDPETGQPSPTAAYDYVMFIKTGRDEPLFRHALATGNLIQRENQLLMKGEVPTVLANDKHKLHKPSHEDLLADPESRNPDSPVAKAVMEHLARHDLAEMGVPFMQGVDPQTGQPYPPATVQFQQAEQQRQMQEQQQAMTQQQQAAQQQGGKPAGPSAQKQQQPQPARTPDQAMQAAAMGQPT